MTATTIINLDKDIAYRNIAYFAQISNHLKEQITNIERVYNFLGHNQVFVHFKNGYSVSILQGWATFDDIEIAVKNSKESLIDYFEDDEDHKDQIYRTDDPDEIVKIMHDVSNL